jgi:peptidoglycan/xylan/chitin deacetylase (PgdA/CDA1 family)
MPHRIRLTFDDGPNPLGTRQILELLAQHEVKATFFIWGQQAARNRDVVREIHAQGHQLEPHCWEHRSHLEMTRSEIRADIDRALGLLAELGIESPGLWRPPFGHVQERVTAAIAHERGLELVGWTIDATDYTGTSAAAMLEIIRQTNDGVPATLLLHDNNLEPIQLRSRSSTVETVKLVELMLSDDGFAFEQLRDGLSAGLMTGLSRRRRSRARHRVARALGALDARGWA